MQWLCFVFYQWSTDWLNSIFENKPMKIIINILGRINNEKYCDDNVLANLVKFKQIWNICIMFSLWVFRWVGIEKVFHLLKNTTIYVKFINIFLKTLNQISPNNNHDLWCIFTCIYKIWPIDLLQSSSLCYPIFASQWSYSFILSPPWQI